MSRISKFNVFVVCLIPSLAVMSKEHEPVGIKFAEGTNAAEIAPVLAATEKNPAHTGDTLAIEYVRDPVPDATAFSSTVFFVTSMFTGTGSGNAWKTGAVCTGVTLRLNVCMIIGIGAFVVLKETAIVTAIQVSVNDTRLWASDNEAVVEVTVDKPNTPVVPATSWKLAEAAGSVRPVNDTVAKMLFVGQSFEMLVAGSTITMGR